MRVPLDWLREHCDPGLDTGAIEQRLTMTGTKVETILRHGVPSTERFVLGKVLAVDPHPDADRLRVCRVDVGESEPAGIVCGAPNVAAGQTVAVALPGAVMPGGMKIKAAKLRGVPSAGMILSEDELEVGAGHEGIMVLDGLVVEAELAPGTALADLLAIGTDVLELEITPNRPDCLGVYGVARELHAATGAPLGPEPWVEDPGSEGPLDGVQVAVECPDLCRRFTVRLFEEVAIAPSPLWLKARLMAAGQRPINNVVDVTNYAMLETGQPMHAFDLDKVSAGRLTVRRAHEGEQVTTLDGQARTLDPEMVVIQDAEGPTSIAGVMGGARSEVGADTKRVAMEVANWAGPNIHRTSLALGLRSEASARFEKDLAPEQCMQAQALATKLMVEVCGARPLQGTLDVGPWAATTDATDPTDVIDPTGGTAAIDATDPTDVIDPTGGTAAIDPTDAARPRIRLRERKVQAILGMPVARPRQAEILTTLGFATAEAQDGLDVGVPAFRRNDVTREADLIEEVARINGLESLPATLPARHGAYGLLGPAQRARRRAVDALVGCGLHEALGWTFTAPALLDRLRLPDQDPRRAAPTLENPLSEDHSQLRTTLIGGLLDAAARNVARGTADVGLFEAGTVFRAAPGPGDGRASAAEKPADGPAAGGERPEDGSASAAERPTDGPAAGGDTGVREHQMLAVALTGRATRPTWRSSDEARVDFYAVKGVMEALGQALRVPLGCVAGEEPFLHPGRAAAVLCDGHAIGWLGELHPLAAAEWGLEGAAIMEVRLEPLLRRAGAERPYRDVISFPALRQDLAVVLPSGVPAAKALSAVREAGAPLLDEVGLFDVYSGTQVGEGSRSLAMSLSFRAPDRTLSDEDVAPVRERIVAALARLGGELRG